MLASKITAAENHFVIQTRGTFYLRSICIVPPFSLRCWVILKAL